MRDDTRDLLLAWHKGDEAAFTALLREHTPWIEQTVRRRLGPALRKRVDTQDIVQNTLIEVLRGAPRFVLTDRQHLRGLLACMVENVLRVQADHDRAQKRDLRREASPPSSGSILFLDAQPAAQATPSQAASSNELNDWVRLALELLEPDDRAVVAYREFEGLSFAEIGDRLEIGEDAARMRFNRALPKLARKMEALRQGKIGKLLPDE
ncbi:MAG: sigma-70 family RNA polymerase sigma factor [Planctomycetota bacterium]